MKWKKVDGAGDMIDARGSGRGRQVGVGAGGLGVGGLLVVIALSVLSGGKFDVTTALDAATSASAGSAPITSSKEEDSLADFSNAVAVNVQDVWTGLFREDGQAYERAKVVRFSGGVNTGCGSATSATGPFYCPADSRVYLDMSFYKDMREQLGAGGDFAWAYVIAHELGHHVQNLVGTNAQVAKLERQDPSAGPGAQGLSVRTELQADCYAGVWAHAAFQKGELEGGDLDEAFGAAEAVGDDRLQRRAGTVRPDSFTHGTSAQRKRWFQVGYEGGKPGECNTFEPDTV